MASISPTRASPPLRAPRVLVVGAGVGGLTAAALLAHEGLDVQVLERAAAAGGKMQPVSLGAVSLDGGPTVLTMRWVFDALFDRLGDSLDRHVHLQRCEVLARHAWGPAEQLDLHADLARSTAAVSAFAGAAEAARFQAYCQRAAQVYATLEQPFMRQARPTPGTLAWRVLRHQGWRGLRQLLRISPFTTLWQELGRYFHDPRLQQLFGRYATYCGTSPFEAPATLMLVSHVEREAVWQVQGGMAQLGLALARSARQHGAQLRLGCDVTRLLVRQGRIAGVQLADGSTLAADAVVFNGDVQALARGLLDDAAPPGLPQRLGRGQPSLSALTWHAQAETAGLELSHHNVFFGPAGAYRDEFEAVAQGRLPRVPTVYVCAQDRRGQAATAAPAQPERLMCLVNAPADAHGRGLTAEEIARCEAQMWARLRQAGLRVTLAAPPLLTRPQDFAQRFPGSWGALYGPASQGWRASFSTRAAGRTALPGLYLAGGSVHPGPGVPMAALSGQLAAEQLLAGLASTWRSRLAATPGGMSTP